MITLPQVYEYPHPASIMGPTDPSNLLPEQTGGGPLDSSAEMTDITVGPMGVTESNVPAISSSPDVVCIYSLGHDITT